MAFDFKKVRLIPSDLPQYIHNDARGFLTIYFNENDSLIWIVRKNKAQSKILTKKEMLQLAHRILKIYDDEPVKSLPKDTIKDWIRKKKIKRFGKNVDEIADEILELLAKKN